MWRLIIYFFGSNRADDYFRPRGGLSYPFGSADIFAGPHGDFCADHPKTASLKVAMNARPSHS